MLKNVLVATHHTAFGELLRLSLEESGLYRVRIAQNTQEVLSDLKKRAFDLAIVDFELPDEPIASIVRVIREQHPAPRFVLIPPDNDPLHPLAAELQADGCLSRPFYLPSMLKMVHHLLNNSSSHSAPEETLPYTDAGLEIPPWLADGELLTERISWFLKDSAAYAVLMTRLDQLFFYMGDISPQDAQELCEILSRYWNKIENYDLARFVRLTSDNTEVLLYAKTLQSDLGIALAHATRMPVSKARAEINQLAQALKAPPADQRVYPPPSAEDILPPLPPEEQPLAATPLQEATTQQTGQAEKEDAIIPISSDPDAPQNQPADMPQVAPLPEAALPNPLPLDFEPAASEENADIQEALEDETESLPANEGAFDEAEILNLNQLLASMPSPDPQRPAPEDTVTSFEPPPSPEETPVTFPWEAQEDLPAKPAKTTAKPGLPAGTVPSAPYPPRASSAHDNPFLDETRPSNGDHAFSPPDPLPLLLAQNEQIYTCLLLTRVPGNKLRGTLGKQLKQWLSEICNAFGWNLDSVTVRPEYLQWSVRLAPAISPANLVRLIRQNTSEKIFSQYPGTKPVDGSEDFWSPGYLIIRGTQPPTQKALFEFIQLTRKRQGYTSG
ncbi:MAG: response regulator [Anaerolineaceae bacterium]|nr:response regulator [Anaerolineaceae bacterium]